MITSAEEKQIDDYLILNKLPLDILLEVRDHMISQIVDIQVHENLSFEQAFFKTKIAWEDEFKMTTYSAFSLEHIPAIFKKIVKANYRKIIRKALIIAFISFLLNLAFIYISPNEETFKVFFKIQNAFFIVVPIFMLVSNYKIWKYIKKDFKYRGKIFYSMYQQNLGLIIVSITSMIQVINGNGEAYTYLFEENTSRLASGSKEEKVEKRMVFHKTKNRISSIEYLGALPRGLFIFNRRK